MTLSARDGEQFFNHLATRDRDGAIAQVTALLDAGVRADEVIAQVLGPAQREVGARWEAGEWSVAQEHLATGITDEVLQAVSLRQRGTAGGRAHVVVACTEGEYHAMPARMLTEVLRSRGFVITFLGASLPIGSIGAILSDTGALALALSCSLSPHLLSAGAAIDMAHAHGVPVIVGGAAFGADDSRARSLGADAWSLDAQGAVAILNGWAALPPAELNVARSLPGDDLDIVIERRQLIEACMVLADGDPPWEAMDAQDISRLRRHVAAVLDHLAASVKTGDSTILSDFLLHLPSRATARLSEATHLVGRVLPIRLATAHRQLDEACAVATAAACAPPRPTPVRRLAPQA